MTQEHVAHLATGSATATPGIALQAQPELHPDAELIRLDHEYLRVVAAIDKAGVKEEALHERLWQEAANLQDRIAETAAHTVTGLAIKMRLLWFLQIDLLEELRNGPNEQSDWSHRLLWSFIAEAERMGGVPLLPLTTGRA